MGERECAWDGCGQPRLPGPNKSYCREHNNLHARKARHKGQELEVVEQRACKRVACEKTFRWSSWGRKQFYCSEECAALDPKERRLAARLERSAAQEVATEKWCPYHEAMMPMDHFYLVRGKPGARCREGQRAADRKWEAAHAGRRREVARQSQRRVRLKGILYPDSSVPGGLRPMTDEDYDVELIKQDFVCPLCLEKIVSYPDTDHDHDTGVFRGFLTRGCNLRLQQAADMAWHERAAAYLRERTWHPPTDTT